MSVFEFLIPRFRSKYVEERPLPGAEEAIVRRKRGRPKGSRNSPETNRKISAARTGRSYVKWDDDMIAVAREGILKGTSEAVLSKRIGVAVKTFRRARYLGLFDTPTQPTGGGDGGLGAKVSEPGVGGAPKAAEGAPE